MGSFLPMSDLCLIITFIFPIQLLCLFPAGGVSNAFCLTNRSDVSSGIPVPAVESYMVALANWTTKLLAVQSLFLS